MSDVRRFWHRASRSSGERGGPGRRPRIPSRCQKADVGCQMSDVRGATSSDLWPLISDLEGSGPVAQSVRAHA
jgi:hypothetical protein